MAVGLTVTLQALAWIIDVPGAAVRQSELNADLDSWIGLVGAVVWAIGSEMLAQRARARPSRRQARGRPWSSLTVTHVRPASHCLDFGSAHTFEGRGAPGVPWIAGLSERESRDCGPGWIARGSAAGKVPLVIAHRGASGYRPEHTLEAYRLAIALGADLVEPDLVVTADGVLVARHENEIAATTDVAHHPEFASRRTTKEVDGRTVTGWFVEDFTVAELKTLRARERLPWLRQRNQLYDDRFAVPTFDEILDLVEEESLRRGRTIGVCPETKHPTYFAGLGLPHEEALLEALRRFGSELPVYIQSFEPWALRRLARRSSLPLVQLVDAGGRPPDFHVTGDPRMHSDLLTPSGLREISTYAQVLGAHKSLLMPRYSDGRLGPPSGLVERAHDAGLSVFAWTFRNENAFLPADRRRGVDNAAYGDAFGEYARFLDLGVDAVFTDHADTAAAAVAESGFVRARPA